jgi:hypothetical protein
MKRTRDMTRVEQRTHCLELAKGFDIWDIDQWELKAARLAKSFGLTCFDGDDDEHEEQHDAN